MKQTGIKRLVVAGGVSANKQLREGLINAAKRRGAGVFFPPISLCTDNGAMIAVAGLYRLENMGDAQRQAATRRLGFSAKPRWPLTQASEPDTQ